jgi:hypothetical protein
MTITAYETDKSTSNIRDVSITEEFVPWSAVESNNGPNASSTVSPTMEVNQNPIRESGTSIIETMMMMARKLAR